MNALGLLALQMLPLLAGESRDPAARALALIQAGDPASALALLEPEREKDPGSIRVLSVYSLALAKSGKAEEAKAFWLKALGEHPAEALLLRVGKVLGWEAPKPAGSALPGAEESEGKGPLPQPPAGLLPSAAMKPGSSAAWKSLVLPGWGQWAAGRRSRALFLGLPSLALMGAGIWAGWAERREVHAYDGALNASAALDHAEKAARYRNLAAAFSAGGGAIWLFGFLDAAGTRTVPVFSLEAKF